jgi:hypothetical protein
VDDKGKPVLINFGGSKDFEVDMTQTLIIEVKGKLLRTVWH